MSKFQKVDNIINKIKSVSKNANQFILEDKQIESNLSSFIGEGEGYLPEGFTIPKDMKLILQINFAEMQHLDKFPTKGILQVWCSGIEMYNRHEGNEGKVIFHKDTTLPQQNIDLELLYLETVNLAIEDPFYLESPLAITFKEQIKTISSLYTNDFDNLDIHEEVDSLDEDEEELFYDEYDKISNETHYIGGFPYFTQSDIREDGEIAIVQLGYCDNLCIGDAGTFQVIIKEEDFKNLNFENAFCNWDCC